jgi:hypothetical protein
MVLRGMTTTYPGTFVLHENTAAGNNIIMCSLSYSHPTEQTTKHNPHGPKLDDCVSCSIFAEIKRKISQALVRKKISDLDAFRTFLETISKEYGGSTERQSSNGTPNPEADWTVGVDADGRYRFVRSLHTTNVLGDRWIEKGKNTAKIQYSFEDRQRSPQGEIIYISYGAGGVVQHALLAISQSLWPL